MKCAEPMCVTFVETDSVMNAVRRALGKGPLLSLAADQRG
jgi:hypothetical protein